MIIGAHAIIYSKDGDADRAFLRDVLRFPNVDVGGGWLIFGLPPSEVAVHPSDANDMHELYLMTDDVEALIADMGKRGVECAPITNQGWGMLTQITLPGGGKLGIYQPRHARPPGMDAPKAAPAKRKAAAAKPAKAPAKKPVARKAAAKPKAKAASKSKPKAKPRRR
jgi:hypothetical protein